MSQNQHELRKSVRIAKALNTDWSYRQMAEVIQITPNAFYNWLNGYYDLSFEKEQELDELVYDLIGDQ